VSTSDLGKAAAAAIGARGEELAELAAALVRFDSVTGPAGNEEPIQRWIAERLRELGPELDVWDVTHDPDGRALEFSRPNVVATWPGSSAGRSLLVNGHVDVVPARTDGWTHDPFGGVVEDDHVWGRGSVDTKGGLAAAIFAIQVLHELGWRPRGTLALHAVMGEESGEGGTHAAIERGHGADAAVVLEPTELTVQPLEGGFLLLSVEVSGTAGHACDRWRLRLDDARASAIDKGLLVVAVLRDHDERWRGTKHHDAFPEGWASLGVNVIDAGTTFGSIPANFHAECVVWYLPGEDASALRSEVEAAVADACVGDAWLESNPPRLGWSLDYPPAVTSGHHPIVETMLAATRASGLKSELKAFEAVSDLRWVTGHHGIPAVLFGPGSLASAHAVDERVSVEDLVQAARVLAQGIASWCGHDD